ncbi:MAG TPA: AAA family ATPase [Thermosynechococcaceae cyanobacterium]
MGSVEPFADNWAYLKAELIWLDRVLSMAVARQRQETRVVDRLARTVADRATSHWWKGLVSLEGEASYDSPAEVPRKSSAKVSFQQQLEAKIQVTQAQGIHLGLPILCDRLQLNSFEKNVLLMALAPEISRRYSRLYNYLQDETIGLPSVDLVLRLLCRTDRDWQQGRQRLTITAPLVQHSLLEIVGSLVQPFLGRSLKLGDRWVDYLLAEQPHASQLAQVCPLQAEILLQWQPTSDYTWSNLELPEALLESLKHLSSAVRLLFDHRPPVESPGTIALLTGTAGTGKTRTARTIAQSLQVPLFWVDLRSLNPTKFPQLLREIEQRQPPMLLLKNAHLWLGRSASLLPSDIHHLLDQRRQTASLTLMSVTRSASVQPQWQRRFDRTLTLPMPNETSRLRLWQAAFPDKVLLDTALDWRGLSQQFLLSGGEIQAIARLATDYLTSEQAGASLSMSHLQKALAERGYVKKL